MKSSKCAIQILFVFLALVGGIAECFADPLLYSSNDPIGHWFVSTNIDSAGDGMLASFKTDNFRQAVAVTGRGDYIANNATGSNGPMGDWTFFVFRQTFNLTGYDPTSANLKFQWAADDSGEGYAARGTWIPKFSLNGGGLVSYPGSPTPTYNYSSVVALASGFVSGLNTIDFYVEGNGVTDGFAFKPIEFTADSSCPSTVPEPATMLLMGTGLAGLAGVTRKKKS